ncbi:MAG: glycosyltransferase family 2 protein [bacterium]
MKDGKKLAAILPAYNAEKTLERTIADIPAGLFDDLILVDDASRDGTVALARKLGLHVVVHPRNRGYGGNQKTCYRTALERGADVVVMIHPDYQYDPTLSPEMVAPILAGQADCVLGSRMLGAALKGRMPVWKYIGNKFLTGVENLAFGVRYSEYHTGYRAYRKEVLAALPLELNSDNFVFDQEIIAQMVANGFRIAEIPIPTRYFGEASSVNFKTSVRYGLETLLVLVRYVLHRRLGFKSKQFERRTGPWPPAPPSAA